MSILSIDFETRATADLRRVGVYPYAMHPNTDIWCMAWAFDEEEPKIWTPPGLEHDPYGLPERVARHIEAGGEIRAWNAQFERVIWQEIMVKRYGALSIQPDQFVDTAAEAAAMALPRSLDQCAAVLGIGEKKDQEGYGLMMRMTRPRKVLEDGTPIWWNVPERLERLYEYCKQDVRVERAIKKALRPLSAQERAIYLLDQRINDRGIYIDRALVVAAQGIVEEGVARADAALNELTGGEVQSVTNHRDLTHWVRNQGVPTAGVSKPAVQELLSSDLDPLVREALQVRVDAGRSSVAKLDSMAAVACADQRARGLFLYHGASTGRWGGKLIQPQNFPRGEVSSPEQFVDDVLAGRYEMMDLFAHPIVAVSSLLRSMLRAAPGHDLIAGDFAAVECRVVNWLAGQEDVLEHFRLYDGGDGNRNPYKIMAVRMGRGVSVSDILKPSDDYQAGKAAELGCGFGMGAEKFVSAAWSVYQLHVSPEEADRAVKIYRESHPQVRQLWYDTERACLEAIRHPGQVQRFGARSNLKALVAGAYLYVGLPSGRALCYAAPREVTAAMPWSTPEMPAYKQSVEFAGVDTYTKKWERQRTYGGHLVENIVQAVARDLLAEGMLRLEALGYPIVLHSHDEAVAEVPKGCGSVEEFCSILAAPPPWAQGCPIAAEGWKGERYQK